MLILQSAQPATITQEELLLWFGYRSQIAMLRRQQALLEESLFLRLEKGAQVDPGPHVAEIRDVRARTGRSKRLVIL